MGFKCGIVGLPNVGKSTLYNALTRANIPAANYPFCTIDPNVGVVSVPDPRLPIIAKIGHSAQLVPATMSFVDIAGLVAGASKGEGLGNQFLAHIRETQAIAQVVRCFDDSNVTHVAGQVNPAADIDVINLELCLADLDTVERALLKLVKEARAGQAEAKQKCAALEAAKTQLTQGRPLRSTTWDEPTLHTLKSLQLLTLKPMMYIANLAEKELKTGNAYLQQVQEIASRENAAIIAVCADIEAQIALLDDEADRTEFLESAGLAVTGLDQVIRAGYQLLDLQTYFTVGPKEARAWTIQKGMTAPQAASVIHTDFEKGFIRAEVISFKDYEAYNGEQGAKEAGKWRLEGRDYIVQDGDLMLFRFNV